MYALVVNVDSANILLPQIREASENVVLHLLHFLHNVPGREGIEVLSSLITHTDDTGDDSAPSAVNPTSFTLSPNNVKSSKRRASRSKDGEEEEGKKEEGDGEEEGKEKGGEEEEGEGKEKKEEEKEEKEEKEGKKERKNTKGRKNSASASDGKTTTKSKEKGGSRIQKGVEKKEGGKTLHFVQNDNVVFSFVEVKHPDREGCFARIIVRDSIGKYTWDTDVLFDYEGMEDSGTVPFPFVGEDGKLLSENFVSPRVPPSSNPLPARKKNDGLIPCYTNRYTEETDQLEQLLDYLTLKFPDCVLEGETSLSSPFTYPEEPRKIVEMTEAALVEQIKEDTVSRIRMQESVPPPQTWQETPQAPPVPKSPYHFCRMLLSHLGFLSENLGTLALILGDEEKIVRGLNQLDLTNGREMVKVGIIYLREGQEEQLEVLRNDSSSRSPLFSEFVRSLGWPIDVPTHRAYLAGLDPKMTTGVTAPYYASSTFEMVFHDLTSMPTTDDPQQIHKKRHVGNDNVHVIWSEHLRDYNPRTIVSEFNDAHIVVYPLPNGLFKIHIYQKDNIDLFGPLMHGMCITKELLPILIRQTGLMANKYVRYTHEGYVTPFTSRKRVLSQMVERHKAETTYRQFIGNVVS
uniref:Rap-GAP domain-containing protein n=1 Tax=Paramoeba aestuarina TaxID=180227 RepID=A0A7S4KWF4_9EUKA